MNKLIGFSTGIKDVQMAPGNIPCVVINNDFINLCNKFGNTAIVIGPQNDNLEIDASKFDALIISGGGDINPERYNQKIDSKTIRISDNRDFTELNLLKSAEENNVKTLAICRGHQLLNVYKGGSLYQDLKESGFTQIEHDKPFEDARSHVHDVKIESNSKLYKIIQENEVQVNSIHHQAINKIGKDLQITAKSSDGVIEGIEVTNGWNAIGVQWHPENMLEDNVSIKLFEWLNS